MKKRIRKEQCDNCGVHFTKETNYCYNCGQENHTPNQPIKHLVLEFFESLFHFDTKVFYSIKNMIVTPGLMTKEFNSNKRARYVPPIRLYIFVSVIFFILVNIISDKKLKEGINDEEIRTQEGSLDFAINDITFDSTDRLEVLRNMSEAQIDSLILVKSKGIDPGFFVKVITKQVIKAYKYGGSFFNNLISLGIKYISISMFILMPLMALLLYFLFYKRRKNYYEYLIFSIQYHTLAFLFLSIGLIVFLLTDWIYILWLVYMALFYYLQRSFIINFDLKVVKSVFYTFAIFIAYHLFLLIGVSFSFLLGFANA